MYIYIYKYKYKYIIYIHIDHLLKPTLMGISWGWLPAPNHPAGGKYHGKHPRVENPMKFAVLNCWNSNRVLPLVFRIFSTISWGYCVGYSDIANSICFFWTDLKMRYSRYSHKTLTFYERKQWLIMKLSNPAANSMLIQWDISGLNRRLETWLCWWYIYIQGFNGSLMVIWWDISRTQT